MAGSASLVLRVVGVVAAGAVGGRRGWVLSSGGSSSAPPATSASSVSLRRVVGACGVFAASSSARRLLGSSAARCRRAPSRRRRRRPRTGCATRDLQAKAGVAQGAAGSIYQVIDFTNISNATCTMYGYPGVSLAAGTPVAQVGAAASRSTVAGPHGRDARAGADGERAAADHAGAELPVGDVLAGEDHVPADLPAEPDDADLPGLLGRPGARRTR